MIDMEKALSHMRIIRTWASFAYERGMTLAGSELKSITEWMDDILALLVAQEARIMTLEEVVRNDELCIVWIERKGGEIKPAIYEKCKNTIGGTAAIFFDFRRAAKNAMFCVSNYGKTFRCWTSRPSDQRREETPWH